MVVVVVVVVVVVAVVVFVVDDDDDDVDDDVILLFIIVDVFVADHGIKFHVVLKLFKGLLQNFESHKSCQCECLKGDFVDEAWHCRPGSRKEVSMVWSGNNADDFELLWDGMHVELWLKLDFGQLGVD